MQQDHILKKLNFDLFTPTPGTGGGGEEFGRDLEAKYLLPCFCIRDSLQIDNNATWHCSKKKMNFDLLPPPSKYTQGVNHKPPIENRIWYASYILYFCLHTKFQ